MSATELVTDWRTHRQPLMEQSCVPGNRRTDGDQLALVSKIYRRCGEALP